MTDPVPPMSVSVVGPPPQPVEPLVVRLVEGQFTRFQIGVEDRVIVNVPMRVSEATEAGIARQVKDFLGVERVLVCDGSVTLAIVGKAPAWSDALPTVEGYYWIKGPEADPFVLRLRKADEGALCWGDGIDYEAHGNYLGYEFIGPVVAPA